MNQGQIIKRPFKKKKYKSALSIGVRDRCILLTQVYNLYDHLLMFYLEITQKIVVTIFVKIIAYSLLL